MSKTRLSESYFFNSAMYYLQRYSSTEKNLRNVLQRKVLRAKQRGEDIPSDTAAWIDKAAAKCVALGFINDELYTESKINSLRREGKSTRAIAQTLQHKGVDRDMIAEQLHSGDNSDAHDFQAALRYIKRRNLGRVTTPEQTQKDLAKLLRAGFPFTVARQALNSKNPSQDHESGDRLNADDDSSFF